MPRTKSQVLIAKIHIAKKDLNLDDETYRQALFLATEKISCAKMTESELQRALDHFKQRGWKPTKGKASPASRDKKDKDRIDKIRALWIQMYKDGFIDNGSEDALNAWVMRTTKPMNNGIGIAQAEWLRGNHYQLATKVLETLKQWQKRVIRKREREVQSND